MAKLWAGKHRDITKKLLRWWGWTATRHRNAKCLCWSLCTDSVISCHKAMEKLERAKLAANCSNISTAFMAVNNFNFKVASWRSLNALNTLIQIVIWNIMSRHRHDWLRILLPLDEASLEKVTSLITATHQTSASVKLQKEATFWPTTTTPSVQYITLKHACDQHNSCN